MKGAIGLEFIGCNAADMLRGFSRLERLASRPSGDDLPPFGPQVAAVSKSDLGQIRLTPLWGKRDYSRANSKGSRGVFVWFTLEEDVLYYVREPKSWRSVIEYYAALTPNGDVYKLSSEEIDEWLKGL